MTSEFAALRSLLTRRLEIIADHPWRARAPTAQLAALADVSAAISAWHQQHRHAIPAQLHHFLSQASLTKALEWLDSRAGSEDGEL